MVIRQLQLSSLKLDADTTPTLAQLSVLATAKGEKIKIIDTVASHWRDLAVILDFDDNGTQLGIIDKMHPSDPKACCQAMFQHWLKGNGRRPCSWCMLIELLEDCNLTVLAEKIKEAVQREK